MELSVRSEVETQLLAAIMEVWKKHNGDSVMDDVIEMDLAHAINQELIKAYEKYSEEEDEEEFLCDACCDTVLDCDTSFLENTSFGKRQRTQ